MQFREKGKKVLCIRSAYVPEKKRTIGITIASQNSYMSTVSEEVCRQLEKEEVDQFKKWLSEREEKRSVDRLDTSLSFVASWMEQAANGLAVDSLKNSLSEEEAAKIWEAHEKLSKALKKAGFNKPVKPKGQTTKKSVDNHPNLPFDDQNQA